MFKYSFTHISIYVHLYEHASRVYVIIILLKKILHSCVYIGYVSVCVCMCVSDDDLELNTNRTSVSGHNITYPIIYAFASRERLPEPLCTERARACVLKPIGVGWWTGGGNTRMDGAGYT